VQEERRLGTRKKRENREKAERTREMAPPTSRQAGGRGKNQAEINSLEKYVTGGDEAWKASLERLIKEIEGLRKEVREEGVKMKEQMVEETARMKRQMMEEMAEIKVQMMEEWRAGEEERRKQGEEWKQERETLKKRIEELEDVNERRERKERRNNIVIRGVK